MKPLVAAIVAAFVFVQPLFAQAASPSRPAGSPGQGVIRGFTEEPDSFEVNSPKGKLQVVIEQSGREARRLLHAKRAKMYGKSLAEAQKELSGGASVFIGFDDMGNLVGAMKNISGNSTGIQQYRYYSYGLNDEGTTRSVVMSGGRLDGKPALFVKLITSSGTETSWIVVTETDTNVLGM